MRVAYGDSNVLKCSVQLAYDRFFTKFNYNDNNRAVLNTEDGLVNSNDSNSKQLKKYQKNALNIGKTK